MRPGAGEYLMTYDELSLEPLETAMMEEQQRIDYVPDEDGSPDLDELDMRLARIIRILDR